MSNLPDDESDIADIAASLLIANCSFPSLFLSSILMVRFYILSKDITFTTQWVTQCKNSIIN